MRDLIFHVIILVSRVCEI